MIKKLNCFGISIFLLLSYQSAWAAEPGQVDTGITAWMLTSTGFRLDPQKELEGLDKSLYGEHGYGLVNSDLIG